MKKKNTSTIFTLSILTDRPKQRCRPRSDAAKGCLSLVQQFCDARIGIKMDLLKYWDEYGKQFRCQNTWDKYGNLANTQPNTRFYSQQTAYNIWVRTNLDMVHYKMIKMDPKSDISKQNCIDYIEKWQKKCIDYIEKWPFMVIFLYNLYIFVWIQHEYLVKTVFALDPSRSVIKRLWSASFYSR